MRLKLINFLILAVLSLVVLSACQRRFAKYAGTEEPSDQPNYTTELKQ